MIFSIFHYIREEFDEEKEPDGMVLSGWTPVLATETKNKTTHDNGASSSTASQTVPLDANEDDDLEILPTGTAIAPGKKRKLSDTNEKGSERKVEELDDDGDGFVMLDANSDGSKKQRVQ